MMRFTNKDTANSPEAERILKGLSSRHIGERLDVEQQLHQMGPEGAELLLQLMADETHRKQTKRRLFWIVLSGGLGMAGALAATLIAIGHPEMMGFLGMFGALGSLSALIVPSQRYYQIIHMLSQQEDVRAVGPLAEALSVPDLNARIGVARALNRLLPYLLPTDAQWLDAAQRAALHKFLRTANPDKETDFMLVILHALDTIEDVSALPTLQALAATSPTTDNARRVQQAAAEYIPHLEAVRDHFQKSEMLLRASDATTPPEHLLRAVQGAAETPAQQLLRAGHGPEEE